MANKISIDFAVHSSPYFLKVMDLSAWQLIENEPSIIEITLPGYESKKTFFFDKCKTNIFNSTLLGISCADGCDEPDNLTLPDGIYHLKLIGSPDSYNKEYYYLKSDLFQMEVDKIYIDNFNKRDNTDLKNQLTQVEFMMKSAESHLRSDDVTRASMLFEKSQEMIDDLKNCASCNK